MEEKKYESLRENQPKVYELAERKLQLNRQIQELKLELTKINENLLNSGVRQALDIVASW
jgi:hypothetical protein